MPFGLRRLPRTEEIFVLGGVGSLVVAAISLVRWRALLLEYFYFTPLVSLTHLVTLGFLSSLMMGMLYRLSPMLLGVDARSRKLASVQLALFLVGAWGMISHFWMAESIGLSWSAGRGWVLSMSFGFQLNLVPTTEGRPSSLPYRFALLHLGTLGLAASLLLETSPAPFALALALVCGWQALGPATAFARGRAREGELLGLLLLTLTAAPRPAPPPR